MGVEADARDVEEGAIVEHADVDGERSVAKGGRERRVGIPRHSQPSGQPVARTSRNEPECGRAAGELAPDFVDGAVAAPDDHEIRARRDRRARQVARVSCPRRQIDRRAELTTGERVTKHGHAMRCGVRVQSRTRDWIDDRGDASDMHDVGAAAVDRSSRNRSAATWRRML